MQGKETRELTQDMNIQRTRVQQPNTVPLAPVRSPQPSSMSKVGEELRGIASVLGGISDQLYTYNKRRADESFIDGQIARAQGKSQQEAESLGMRAGAGWVVADMKASADNFFVEQNEVIQREAYRMKPEEYRAYLNTQFQAMYKDVPNDAGVKAAALELSNSVFPRLAAEQTKAHQAFNYEQTRVSVASMINSTLDAKPSSDGNPDTDGMLEVEDYIPAKSFGLSPDDHYAMLADVAAYRAEALNDPRLAYRLTKQMQGTAEGSLYNAVDPHFTAVEHALTQAESSGRTFAQDGSILQGPEVVRADGSVRMGPSGSPDRARGKYQVMESTFKDPYSRRLLGLPEIGNWDSAEEVNEFGRRYLQRSMALVDGDPKLVALLHTSGWSVVDIGVNKAGLPDPRKGEISPEDFARQYTVWEQRNKPDSVREKEISRLTKERLDHMRKVGDAVGASPLPQPSPIMNEMPASYASYQKLQQTYAKAMKQQAEEQMVRDAVSTNMLGTLGSQQQKAGLQIMRKEVLQQAMRENPQQPGEDGLSYQARLNETANKLYFTKLHEQPDIIDRDLKGAIAASLSAANIMDPKAARGVSEDAISTLGTLVDLSANTSPQYVEKYLPENDDVIRVALSLAENGTEYAEALKAAVRNQELVDSGVKRPMPEDSQINSAIRDSLGKYASGFWDRILPQWAQDVKNPEAGFLRRYNLGVSKDALERALKGEQGQEYTAKITALTKAYVAQGLPPNAAANKAVGTIGQRTIMVSGKLLTAPATVDMSKVYGLDPNYFNQYPGAMTLAVSQYLRAVGDYSFTHDMTLANLDAVRQVADISDKIAQAFNVDSKPVLPTATAMLNAQKAKMGEFGPGYKDTLTPGSLNPFATNNGTSAQTPAFDRQKINIDWGTGDVYVNLIKEDGTYILPTDLRIPAVALSQVLRAIPRGASRQEIRDMFEPDKE